MLTLTTEEVLYEDDALRLSARPAPSDAFVERLRRTSFGSEGLRYRRLDIGRQIERLPDSVYLELRRRDRLIGTYVVANSRLWRSGREIAGLYRGLLTMAPDDQGRGYGRLIVDRTLAWLGAHARDSAQPTITWGCIEQNNARSLSLLRSMGASTIATIDSLMAYRQWPRARIALDEVSVSDLDAVNQALAATYADCPLRTIMSATGGYFAVTDGSRIVAGARATMSRVDMLTTGGLWDLFYDKLLRHVPAARRRFDPHNFRYLRLDDVVVTANNAKVWRDLLPALLARHDAHMAMFIIDPRSRAHTLLAGAGVFGRFAQSTRQRIVVLAAAWNAPDDTLASLAGSPIAIGPLDS